MDNLWQVIGAVVIGAVSSSGFWAWFQHRDKTKNATTKLMMGLAYDKIVFLGLKYIERGWITTEELDDFRKYFYEPYRDLGGNGVAEKVMGEIDKLHLRSHTKYADILQAVKRGQEKENDPSNNKVR